jgi:hypothetical protein
LNSVTNIHNEFTINVSAAENIDGRVRDIEAETDKLFQARQIGNGDRTV